MEKNVNKNGITGIIFVKIHPGNEVDFSNWILQLFKAKHGECENCKVPNGVKKPCLSINYNKSGINSVLGFFDASIIVRAETIDMIEDFVINCIRGSDMKKVVQDTQTIMGKALYP